MLLAGRAGSAAGPVGARQTLGRSGALTGRPELYSPVCHEIIWEVRHYIPNSRPCREQYGVYVAAAAAIYVFFTLSLIFGSKDNDT